MKFARLQLDADRTADRLAQAQRLGRAIEDGVRAAEQPETEEAA